MNSSRCTTGARHHQAAIRGEGPNEKESPPPCRLEVHSIRSPGYRGEAKEGKVKPGPKRDAMKHVWRGMERKAWGETC